MGAGTASQLNLTRCWVRMENVGRELGSWGQGWSWSAECLGEGLRRCILSILPPPCLCAAGDTLIDGGEHYWEVRFEPDSKAFGLGVAYRSLGRFEQLGKTAASWCLHANNWLQASFTAKHANKVKVLDGPVPDCLGVHCHFHQGAVTFPSQVLMRRPLPCSLPTS